MVILKEDIFDKFNGHDVMRYTWTTVNGMTVSVITYGATITSIRVPDKNGTINDVVLGFDDMSGYLRSDNPYFGATVGRCANRIAGAKFQIDGKVYQLAKNIGENHLHGGKVGFDKVIWNATVSDNKVIFSHLSLDNDENYPGDLLINVIYEVTDQNVINIEFIANTSKSTVVNLTNHSYFNLAGHDTGAQGLYEHCIAINADRITEVDSNSIPTGNLLRVGGTNFDLRTESNLGDNMSRIGSGYDHNFCITKGISQESAFTARAVHHPSGRYLEVYTNQPGVQFYTSNFLPTPQQEAVPGKSGAGYRRHGAFCLETQNYPDAVNHQKFPNAVLRPGDRYYHQVKYIFGVQESKSIPY